MSHPKNKRERFEIGKRKGWKRIQNWNGSKDNLIIWSQQRRNTTKICSCSICGNARKYYGKTTQEQKFIQSIRNNIS